MNFCLSCLLVLPGMLFGPWLATVDFRFQPSTARLYTLSILLLLLLLLYYNYYSNIIPLYLRFQFTSLL
jgi:hypothetical protein